MVFHKNKKIKNMEVFWRWKSRGGEQERKKSRKWKVLDFKWPLCCKATL